MLGFIFSGSNLLEWSTSFIIFLNEVGITETLENYKR